MQTHWNLFARTDLGVTHLVVVDIAAVVAGTDLAAVPVVGIGSDPVDAAYMVLLAEDLASLTLGFHTATVARDTAGYTDLPVPVALVGLVDSTFVESAVDSVASAQVHTGC